MSTYVISDTHFSHTNIIKYSLRPFKNITEMNEVMIENWNKLIKPTDNIWHLGDFAFMKAEQLYNFIPKLNGYKMFIHGNHDQEIMRNQNMFLGRPYFTSISSYAEFKYNEFFIVLSHYSHRVWNKSHHGSIHLFGHSHGSLAPYGKSVDVGVDAPFIINRYGNGVAEEYSLYHRKPEDYRPIHIDEIIDWMKTRNIEKPDHHNERY